MIVAVALLRGDPVFTTLQFALVLTVAAIPVAMPTVLSVTMAVGARLLADKKAVVSRLVAIEELAGVDMLCADKTGTLTQNTLTLGEPFTVEGSTAAEVILAGALASRADNDDPIDLAVLGGVTDRHALGGYTVTHFQPFDPVHKRTEATVTGPDGTTFTVTKGAPQVILALAADPRRSLPPSTRRSTISPPAASAPSGWPAPTDGRWQFLGVLPLFDPPRADAKSTIATARAMGVSVKMVTGDALAIAKETAAKVGLGTNILDAAGLGEVKKNETPEMARSIETADGFAQVFPEHKFHIVDVLQTTRPHRRHDRRRRQRRSRAEEGRLRHRRLRRHRRRPRGRLDRAAHSRPLSDHRRDQGKPEDLPADEQLRDVSHRRNTARPAVRDTSPS